MKAMKCAMVTSSRRHEDVDEGDEVRGGDEAEGGEENPLDRVRWAAVTFLCD